MKILPFAATWMDLEVIILSEVSQTEKYHLYVQSKKRVKKNLFTKQKQTHRDRKLMVINGEGGGADKLGA